MLGLGDMEGILVDIDSDIDIEELGIDMDPDMLMLLDMEGEGMDALSDMDIVGGTDSEFETELEGDMVGVGTGLSHITEHTSACPSSPA